MCKARRKQHERRLVLILLINQKISMLSIAEAKNQFQISTVSTMPAIKGRVWIFLQERDSRSEGMMHLTCTWPRLSVPHLSPQYAVPLVSDAVLPVRQADLKGGLMAEFRPKRAISAKINGQNNTEGCKIISNLWVNPPGSIWTLAHVAWNLLLMNLHTWVYFQVKSYFGQLSAILDMLISLSTTEESCWVIL